MQYWLIKSEPSTFSINHLAECNKQTTGWDGVRNYQARNFMRDDMQIGDLAFFYHSNCKVIGITGIARVSSTAYPDHTAFDPDDHHFDPNSDPAQPRWVMVDFTLVEKFSHTITLDQLKNNPALEGLMILRKGNRLSITPVSEAHWNAILKMR